MENNIKSLIPLLKSLILGAEDEDINAFLKICNLVVLKNKEAIIKSNKKGTKAFFILKGTIRGYLINNKGVEKNIFLRPTYTFMGAPNALFNEEVSKYTFEAIGETELLVFEFNDLESLALKNPTILKFYLSAYKEIVQTLTYRIESMINKMPEDRYEDLLQKSPQFFKTVYHKDIANYLGITPVSLSRIMKRKLEKK
ncbi:Crp/Fnr family transcriptional regulator [Olleya sp. R77988]|uniref:Crp/Fnr family transcriptional regulator n=1 Tax=Olleya sp. R77988 TaxID=3093875 RepID=UPI0037C50BA4